MLGRNMLRINGSAQAGPAGYRNLNNRRVFLEATAATMTLTAAHIAAGYVLRSGQAGAIADVLPTADQLLAAFPELTRGDTFDWMLGSSTANANVIVAGTGITLAGTTSAAASSVREYLFTLTSEPKRTSTIVGTTTNASAVLSGFTEAQLSTIGVGMGVSGTGIGASALVVAVNLTAKTVTVSVVSTATADNIGITFTPQFECRGIRTAAL